MSDPNASDLPSTVAGLLPRASGHPAPAHGGVCPGRLGAPATSGTVLNFRDTGGWGNVAAPWTNGVSSASATFEAWIRTSVKDEQTILLGSNSPGATPRISIGGDQISVYWSTGGATPGWTSTDTTAVTDGQWHHIAVVFDGGAITFYKDGVATADRLTVPGTVGAAGTLQLGAGFGGASGFVGQIWNARVWSIARAAADIQNTRWAPLGSGTSGLVASIDFNATGNVTVDRVSGAEGSITDCNIITTDLPTPTVVLSLPGSGGFVVDNAAGEPPAVTLECWVRMSTDAGVASAVQSIMALGVAVSVVPVLVYEGGDRLGIRWSTSSYTSTDTRTISDGAWHHVAMVLAAGQVTFYKDGVACADTYQLPSARPLIVEGVMLGAAPSMLSGIGAWDGQLYDARVWVAARSAAEISSFRWAKLAGDEPDLGVLVNMASADPTVPGMGIINEHMGAKVEALAPAVPLVADQPEQPLPQQVWTYPTPGLSPVGPTLSPAGVLCTDHGTSSAPGAFLRNVEVQTGQAVWSYNAQTTSKFATAVIPSAVSVAGTTAYVGVDASQPGNGFLEVHPVDLTSGTLIGPTPISFAANAFLTRPVVSGSTAYVGVDLGGVGNCAIAFAALDGSSGNAWVYVGDAALGFMADPVIVANMVYTAVAEGGQTTVLGFPLDTYGATPPLKATLPAAVTAGVCLGDGVLYVVTGGTVVSVDTGSGAPRWTHELSGSPVHAAPVLIGTTLCIGSTDGVVYTLDAIAGTELWRVGTGSAITTDLVVEDGVLYFANEGDGADTAPAFMSIDTVSLGNDVLSYTVPETDTILFVQGGVTNGVVYFYGTQTVYAVDMANVIHEFAVTSKLIVEDYSIPTDPSQDPTGSDTSYRVTLSVRDENGVARIGQAIKVWSADTVYVVNQGDALALTPDAAQWFESGSDGSLTLAVSAFDDGTPTGNPNLACPPLYVWSSFMGPDEAIVIYPDHEQLTSLSTLQGPTPSGIAAAPGTLYLDTATGYDGTPLILPAYTDATSLTNIASTVRNTIGSRNPTSVGATTLTGHTANKHVRATDVFPNAVFTQLGDGAPTRPWVAGADPTFTIDLSSGLPVYTTTYDPSAPSTGVSGEDELLKSIFSDIKHFVDNVVKGVETVAKMAWTAAEDVVTTVIHTAESVYNLTITTLEDAVSAVAGFFKSVVADVRKVIQFLSALFQWDNILKNHAIIKAAITNPSDPSNPGIVDQLAAWVTNELGTGTDTSSTLAGLVGQGSSSMTSSSSGMGGSTVGQQSASSGNDPNAAYNSGGQNNATQCTYMHQKMKENAAGASVSALLASTSSSGLWDSGTITGAWDTFTAAVDVAVKSSFADLPTQMHAAMATTADAFKDPKSLVSAGFADILAAFEAVADDMIDFAEQVAKDFLQLIDTLLTQLVAYLDEPIHIPFISELWSAITHGDPLTLLDLMCLLAAIPGTILLGVLTGSPVVPVAVGLEADAALAKQILLGIAGFEVAVAASFVDLMSLYFTLATDAAPGLNAYWSKCDLASDFISWALNMVVSQGWSTFTAKDWPFWGIQSLPILGNFCSMFYTPDWSKGGADQLIRDTLWGIIFVVVAGVYASKWHTPYRDATDAPGLVISANTLTAMSGIDEFLLFVCPLESPEGQVVMVAKLLFAEVGNVLGFTANVVNAVRAA